MPAAGPAGTVELIIVCLDIAELNSILQKILTRFKFELLGIFSRRNIFCVMVKTKRDGKLQLLHRKEAFLGPSLYFSGTMSHHGQLSIIQ